MGIRNFPAITVESNGGVEVGNISAPGNVAIPTLSSGILPKYVLLHVTGGNGGDAVSVSPQVGAVNGAAATGMPLVRDTHDRIILNVHGYSHIGYEDLIGVTCDLHIIPLADF